MPFPDEQCEAAALPEACCSSLWQMMSDILAAVVPYMEQCIVATDCTPPMRYFVSIGRPESWITDFLALYLENIIVDQGSQRLGKTLPFPIILGQFRFLLQESGYPGPMQAGNEIVVPNDDDFHRAAKHGYAHAQALLRGLLNYVAGSCEGFVLRDLQPTRAETYTAGWSLGFSLELPR